MSKVKSITPLPPADFTPELGNYKALQPFRYWCQKVLPLVYDDSLSYYELLCKVVDYLNKTMEDVETLHGYVTNLHTVYEKLQSYVNNYFSTLDVQEEIDNKLNEMSINGTLSGILNTIKQGNAIYVGNSYTVGVGSSNNKGIYELTKHLFNVSWIAHDSGAGFSTYLEHENTFSKIVEYQANHMTTDEKNSVNHVIFISAIGDTRALIERNYNTIDAFNDINGCVTKAKTLFPNAEICIAFAETVINGYGGTNAQAQLRFNKLLNESCANIGFRYLGWIGWDTNHYATNNANDNYHPNDRGYRFLKNNFINSFFGSFNIVPKHANVSIGDYGTMYVVYTPDKIELRFGSKSDLNTVNEQITLFNFNDKNIGIVPYSNVGNFIMNVFEQNFEIKNGFLNINDGILTFTPFGTITLKNGYYTFDTILAPTLL